MFHPALEHLPSIERKRIVMPDRVTMRVGRLEKPEPWPAELVDELRRTMPLDCIQQYPDYPPFYRRLAAHIGRSEDEIVVGAGIEEFIRILMTACFGQRVVTLWPSCAMMDVYAMAFRVDLDRIVTDPHQGTTEGDITSRITDDTAMVMLANPGQPVETFFSLTDLRIIAQRCNQVGAVLAIDEAYHGFGAPTALPLIDEFENVVVLRTFSKAFGAAGLRIGYAVAGPRAKRAIDAVRQSGEVSSLSMHCATVLMDNYRRFVVPSVREICASRDWLRIECKRIGLHAWGSLANHVLIECSNPRSTGAKIRALNAHGIYPRPVLPPPLDSCMLVTCGSMALTKSFFDWFRSV